mmetsp:Transcript_35453/g.110576  ORF Transcript_35453/g.110576 Transcript_35453/m.110576 type:complete len:203 (+) Transcript_35453:79-687(+)
MLAPRAKRGKYQKMLRQPPMDSVDKWSSSHMERMPRCSSCMGKVCAVSARMSEPQAQSKQTGECPPPRFTFEGSSSQASSRSKSSSSVRSPSTAVRSSCSKATSATSSSSLSSESGPARRSSAILAQSLPEVSVQLVAHSADCSSHGWMHLVRSVLELVSDRTSPPSSCATFRSSPSSCCSDGASVNFTVLIREGSRRTLTA